MFLVDQADPGFRSLEAREAQEDLLSTRLDLLWIWQDLEDLEDLWDLEGLSGQAR